MPKVIQKQKFNINHDEVNSTLKYAELIKESLSDEELERIEKFKNLETYEQDILMLNSQGYSLREIGGMLDVSYQWVRSQLIIIRNKLNSNG